MCLKERRQQLEQALYFKAVGIPKQAAAGASYGKMGTGMFKRIIDQFSFGGKSRKKAFS